MVDPGVAGADQSEGQTCVPSSRSCLAVLVADSSACHSPSWPSAHSRHWLVNNVYLTPGDDETYTLNFTTDAITTYGGPYPADGSGPHRYTILLLPQPESFTAPADLSTPGVAISTFDFPGYVTDSGLGEPVAGWYMTVEQGTSTVTASSTAAVESSTLAAAAATTCVPFPWLPFLEKAPTADASPPPTQLRRRRRLRLVRCCFCRLVHLEGRRLGYLVRRRRRLVVGRRRRRHLGRVRPRRARRRRPRARRLGRRWLPRPLLKSWPRPPTPSAPLLAPCCLPLASTTHGRSPSFASFPLPPHASNPTRPDSLPNTAVIPCPPPPAGSASRTHDLLACATLLYLVRSVAFVVAQPVSASLPADTGIGDDDAIDGVWDRAAKRTAACRRLTCLAHCRIDCAWRRGGGRKGGGRAAGHQRQQRPALPPLPSPPPRPPAACPFRQARRPARPRRRRPRPPALTAARRRRRPRPGWARAAARSTR